MRFHNGQDEYEAHGGFPKLARQACMHVQSWSLLPGSVYVNTYTGDEFVQLHKRC